MERIDRDLRTETQVLDAPALDARLRPHGAGSAKAGLFDTLMLQLISNPSRATRREGEFSARPESTETPRDAHPSTPSPLERRSHELDDRPAPSDPSHRHEAREKNAPTPSDRAAKTDEGHASETASESAKHEGARDEIKDRPRAEKVSATSAKDKISDEEIVSEIAALVARFLAREAQGAREAGARERDRLAKNAKAGSAGVVRRADAEPTDRIRGAVHELLREANRLLSGRAVVSAAANAARHASTDSGARAIATRHEDPTAKVAPDRGPRHRFHERVAKLLSNALEAAGVDRGAAELRVVSIEVTSVRRMVREIDPRVKLSPSLATESKSAEERDRASLAARDAQGGGGKDPGGNGRSSEFARAKERLGLDRGLSPEDRAHANPGVAATAKKGERTPLVLKTDGVPLTPEPREDGRLSLRQTSLDAARKTGRESVSSIERTSGADASGRLAPRDAASPHETKKAEPAPLDTRLLIAQLENPLSEAAHKAPSSIRMSLDPEHLGRVTLDVSVKDGVISARIETEGLVAKEALDSGRDQLRNALEARGIKVGEISVGLGSGSEGDTAQRQSRPFEPETRHASPRGGDAFSNELDPALASASARTLSSDLYPESTVNVRV